MFKIWKINIYVSKITVCERTEYYRVCERGVVTKVVFFLGMIRVMYTSVFSGQAYLIV
jgi:hypothetical protein